MYKLGFLFAAVCLSVAIAKSACPLSLDSNPICASDGQTFGNICELSHAQYLEPNLELLSAGPCEEDITGEGQEGEQDPEIVESPSCDCPIDEDPICGSDGNTYGNFCLLNCAQNENPLLEIVKAKPCEDTVEEGSAEDQSCNCPEQRVRFGNEVGMEDSTMCCGPVLFPKVD